MIQRYDFPIRVVEEYCEPDPDGEYIKLSDVLALLDSPYKSPHNESGHYSAMPCREVEKERARLRAALGAE